MVVSKKWNLKKNPDEELLNQLVDETSYSKYFIELCLQRDLDTKDKIEEFIHPGEDWFHDPFLLNDMEKTTDRIIKAIEENELITVYGDYDADGITSTSIMIEVLETLGAQVNFYIPNRFTDGYGPNVEVFSELINQGTGLILTVDNGVAGHEAITAAKNQGIDVIVTDHHELPDELPDAYSIVHPRHPERNYPFGDLSGAGVALKLAQALLEEIPMELLELAAIGTVADLVSLKDENRVIVKYGLQVMKQSQRIGLTQLLKQLDIPAVDADETTIGFKIGPILNALGRLESADKAVYLLTTFDMDYAAELSTYLIEKNEERKQIVKDITAEVLEKLAAGNQKDELVILADENWHQGVLGIVASRIVGETGKPTILFKNDPDKGILKGSARSVESFNMFEACNEVRDLFISFGGHHMAAGITVSEEKFVPFKEALNDKAREIQKESSLAPEIEIDLDVPIEDVTIDGISEVELLAPFGTANPSPTVQFSNVKCSQIKKIGVDKNHLKMAVIDGYSKIDAVGFQFGDLADVINENSRVSLAGTVNINEWNGFRKAQMIIDDVKVVGPVISDKRATNLTEPMLNLEKTHFICFQENIYESIKDKIVESSSIQLIETVDDKISNSAKQIVYVDCPPNIDLFKAVFLKEAEKKSIIYFYSHYNLFLKGIPSREEFTKLYKYIATHLNIPTENAQKQLGGYLNINRVVLNFMLEVFSEANFVKISNGMININSEAKKTKLFNTETFKKYKEQIEAEKLLIYSSYEELMSMINGWVEANE